MKFKSDVDVEAALAVSGSLTGTTGTLTGNLTVGDGSLDSVIRTTYTDGAYVDIHGYGIAMSRASAYIRPVANNTQALYIGNAGVGDNWSVISNNAATHLWKSGGSEFMRLTAAGSLGIGITSPAAKLHVSGSVQLDVMPTNESEGSIKIGRYDANTSRYNLVKNFVSATAASNYMRFAVHNGTENATVDVMSLNGAGNVGIGTTSPGTQKLYVDGGETTLNRGNTDGAIATFRGKNNVQAVIGTLMSYFTGNVGIGMTNPGVRLDIDGGDGGASVRVKGDQPAGTYYYGYMYDGTNLKGTTQTNIFHSGSTIAANTTIAEYAGLRIDAPSVAATGAVITNNYGIYQSGSAQKNYFNGNVGIGTTDPSEKLHVSGNLRVTGAFADSSASVGSAGTVLSSTNTGTAWVGASGLPGGPYLPLTGGTLTGDLIIESALLSNQENTNVDTGAETVASVLKATYTAAFFDFVIKEGTNLRAGTVFACHDGTNVVYTETSTNDLGDTSDVTLSVDILGTAMRLRATVTSDDWIIKSLIRAI